MNWCFIGAGGLAGDVAKQLTASGRHRVVSVYARRWENCREFGTRWGAEPFRTPEEAICAPEVEAVYVVTPHNSHYMYARLALELGKPVLVEKPFTVGAAETRELIGLARERGLYLAEAMWTWFSPVARQVKDWVDAGALGEIHTAELTYCFYAPKRLGRLHDPERAGGALLDIGVYPVTYLYRLFGRPTGVVCTGTVSGGVDREEDIALTFQNGLTARVRCSIAGVLGGEHLRLEGDKGVVRLGFYHFARKVTLERRDGPREVFRGDGSMLNEFDRVSEEIASGLTESRYVPLEATGDVMDILDECRRQMGLRYPFE